MSTRIPQLAWQNRQIEGWVVAMAGTIMAAPRTGRVTWRSAHVAPDSVPAGKPAPTALRLGSICGRPGERPMDRGRLGRRPPSPSLAPADQTRRGTTDPRDAGRLAAAQRIVQGEERPGRPVARLGAAGQPGRLPDQHDDREGRRGGGAP